MPVPSSGAIPEGTLEVETKDKTGSVPGSFIIVVEKQFCWSSDTLNGKVTKFRASVVVNSNTFDHKSDRHPP